MAARCTIRLPPGRKSRRLTAGDKDSDPRWSPDGSRIAFTAKRKDDAEAQIYLIAPDGGEATRLTSIDDRRPIRALVFRLNPKYTTLASARSEGSRPHMPL